MLIIYNKITVIIICSDELKASQNSMVDKESVKELLDIMDANMSKDFLSEADSDILSHPVWDQLMMVTLELTLTTNLNQIYYHLHTCHIKNIHYSQ